MRGWTWWMLLWATYLLLTLLSLSALTLLTLAVRHAEWAEAQARAAALQAESQRVALWRLDTALGPLVARENLRPVDNYLTLPAERLSATDSLVAQAFGGGVDSPAQTLQLHALERFQWSPRAGWSYVVVDGVDSDSAARHWTEQTAADLQRLTGSPAESRARQRTLAQGRAEADQDQSGQLTFAEGRSRDAFEFSQRSQNLDVSNRLLLEQTARSAESELAFGPLMACWHHEELLLVRQLGQGGRIQLQGCRIDWPALKSQLRNRVEDILPTADFQPASSLDAATDEQLSLLAALPVRLIPGAPGDARLVAPSATASTLVVAWISAGIALAAAGLLLAGMQRLSQRRAAFVAAVTHELRTPLTTFQLYTDMLASGMIDDAARRKTYLETLRAESSRLNHLVENVLAYSRLERGRAFAAVQPVTVAALMDKFNLRLDEVAARSKMRIEYQLGPVSDSEVTVNPSLVEQILLNLVDNACKYAAGAEDRRIIIGGAVDADQVTLSVQDFGPGFSHRRGWPRPFSKTVEQAAASAPGIGLGLSLSRRLARQLGGRLQHQPSASGTRMVLSLPRSKGPASRRNSEHS